MFDVHFNFTKISLLCMYHVSHDFCVENSPCPISRGDHPLTNKLQDSGPIECSNTRALTNPSWGTLSFFFFLLRSVGNPLKKAQRRRKLRRQRRRKSSRSHRLPRKRNLKSGEELLSRMFSTMMRWFHFYNDQTNNLQNITWLTRFQHNQERIMIPSGRYSKL